MKNKQPTLAEELDEALIADAKERNPGVTTDAVTLTRRWRIIAGVTEARINALVSHRVRAEMSQLRKRLQQDDGS